MKSRADLIRQLMAEAREFSEQPGAPRPHAVSLEDAARELKTTVEALLSKIEGGDVLGCTLGRKLMIPASELERLRRRW
jgi:hypothetical protein